MGTWHTSWTPAAGTLCRATAPTAGNERVFVCTVSGAVSGTQPTWVVTKGSPTTDTSATWHECTGQPGVNGDHYSACTVATNATTSTSSTVLNVAASPAALAVGQLVINKSTPASITPGTTVLAYTSTTITLSAVPGSTVGSGDTIAFSNTPMWGLVPSTAVTTGYIISNNAGTYLFICTRAGTTGSTEPTWSTTAGQTTNDPNAGGAGWTSLGANTYAAWAAPHNRLTNALTANWAAAGNYVFVGDDHNETNAAAVTIAGGTALLPIKILSIDHTAAMPAKTVKSGATVATSTTNILGIGPASGSTAAGLYFNGLTFSSGSGANTTVFNIFNGGQPQAIQEAIFENCTLKRGGTSAGNFNFGNLGGPGSRIKLINTVLSFGNAGDRVLICTRTIWKNTASAIAGTTPTTGPLFQAYQGSTVFFDGVDLSAYSGTIFGSGNTYSIGESLFIDCKLHASATPCAASTTGVGINVNFIRCSSSAIDYTFGYYCYEGNVTQNTNVILTGGASDGTQGVSYRFLTPNTTAVNNINPLEGQPIVIWNPTIQPTDVIVTLHGISNTATMPRTSDVYFECEYMGSSTAPLASFDTTAPASLIVSGGLLTADTGSAWDSGVTAFTRGGSPETVAVGAIRDTATCPGMVFFCTAITTGVVANPEPAGYSGAVDGQSITDGGATFRAGYRFSMAVTLSPQVQIVGYLRVIPKTILQNTTLFIDPKPVLS